MNAEKLKRLQAQVRIGGKGTPRRKKKVVHQTAATDDKKLQSSLKKLSVSTIPGIEEVNIIKDDLSVIHFNNPKAQASLAANTFAITGHGENKKVVEMLPEILPQLGQDTVLQLRRFANNMAVSKTLTRVAEEEDVPTLVGNFDEASKNEAPTAAPLLEIQKPNELANIIDAKDVSKTNVEESLGAKPTTDDKPHPTNVSEVQAVAQTPKSTQDTCRDGKAPELDKGKEPAVCLKDSTTSDSTPQHQTTPTGDEKKEEIAKAAEKKIEQTIECAKPEMPALKETQKHEEKQSQTILADVTDKKQEGKEREVESTSKTKSQNAKHGKGKSQQMKLQDGKADKTQQTKVENDKICPTNQQSPNPVPHEIAHQNENKKDVVIPKQEETKSEAPKPDMSTPEPHANLNKEVKSEAVSLQQITVQKPAEPKNETPMKNSPQSKEKEIEQFKSDAGKPETVISDKIQTVDVPENKASDPTALPAEEEKRAIFVEIKSPAEVATPKTPETDKSNMQLVEKKNLQIVEKPDMPISIVQPPIISSSAQPASPATEEKSTKVMQSPTKPETPTVEKEKISAPLEDNKEQEAKKDTQEKPDASKKSDGKKGEKGKAKTPPPQKKGDKPQQKGSGKQTPQGKRTPATSESESKTEETVSKKVLEEKSVKPGKQPAGSKQTPQGKRTPATSESEPKEESIEKKAGDKSVKEAPEKSQAKHPSQGKRTPGISESDAKCDDNADKQATSTPKAKTEESTATHTQPSKQQQAQGKSAQPPTKSQQQQKKPQPKKLDDVKTTGGEQTKQSQKPGGKQQQKPSGASVPSVTKKEAVPQPPKKAN